MSVKVNLLPGEVRARGAANRARILAGVVGVVLLLVLAGLSLLQRSAIRDAEAQLAAVQEENQALEADIAALQPFADLEARAQSSVDIVSRALGDEASFTGVLQDLSAVLPPNAQLDTISLTFNESGSAPAPGGERVVFGQLTATGQVLDGVAPGVERLIIDLDRITSFDNVYVTTSVVDEEGIATFSIEAEFGPEVRTDRYVLETQDGGA